MHTIKWKKKIYEIKCMIFVVICRLEYLRFWLVEKYQIIVMLNGWPMLIEVWF